MSRLSVMGYTGLMPFIALPLLYLQPFYLSAAQTLELYSLYSALILGFMAGVLWPVWSQQAALRPLAMRNTQLMALGLRRAS